MAAQVLELQCAYGILRSSATLLEGAANELREIHVHPEQRERRNELEGWLLAAAEETRRYVAEHESEGFEPPGETPEVVPRPRHRQRGEVERV